MRVILGNVQNDKITLKKIISLQDSHEAMAAQLRDLLATVDDMRQQMLQQQQQPQQQHQHDVDEFY